jgi:xanthosine utilization system XapX-like protein
VGFYFMDFVKKILLNKTAKEIYLVLPLIVILFFANVANILVSKSNATGLDNTFLLIPIFSYVSKVFSSGEFPYWINHVLGGLSIYNTPQFSALYPLYFFKAGLFQTPVKAIDHFHYVLLFHFLLLYINTYIFMRVIKVTMLPAVFIASLFAFSINIQQYACWINIIAPYTWFPLAIASIVLATRQENRKTGIWLGVLAIPLLIIASPAQPFIHFVFVSGILVGYKIVVLIKEKQYQQLIHMLIALGVIGGISIILVSPVLIPTMLAQKGNIRWTSHFAPIIGNAKMVFEAFTIGQPNRLDFLNILFPANKSILLGNPYLGLSVIFLSFFAYFQRKKHSLIVYPLFFLSLYSLLSSYGTGFGLAYFNYHIPLINLIREPGRFVILYIFSTLALAGLGLDYIVDRLKNSDKKFLWQYSRMLLLFLVVSVLLYLGAIALKIYPSFSIVLFLAFLLFALPLLLLFYFKKKWSVILLAIICIAVGMKVIQFPWKVLPVKDGDYFSESNLVSHKVLKKISELEDISEYRVAFEDGIDKQKWSMNALCYGINSLNCYFNPLPYKQFQEMYYHLYREKLSEILGVKYIVCKSEEHKAVQDSELIFSMEEYKVYANTKALPKVFIVNEIGGYYNNSTEYQTLVGKGFDYKKSVVLEKTQYDTFMGKLAETGVSVNSFKKTFESLNRLVLETDCEANSILVLNYFYNSNWHVKINGVKQNSFKVNLNQIGVFVEAGTNVVEFTYKPVMFSRLRLLQQVVIALLVLFVLYQGIVVIRKKYLNTEVAKTDE